MPATPRESSQCRVCWLEAARIASGIPGASRSTTARVASGVTSVGAKPVPPVVRIRSQRSVSAQWRRRSSTSRGEGEDTSGERLAELVQAIGAEIAGREVIPR